MIDSIDLTIDKAQATPAYLQLSQQLSAAIGAGLIPPGRALPSERYLAVRLGLSRMTVRRAIEELAVAKLVEQRRGSGTYVRPERLEQHIDRLVGFADELRSLGARPGTRILDSEHLPADGAVARALSLSEGERVLRIERLRLADEKPLAVQVAYLVPKLAGIDQSRLEAAGSLYRLLERDFGVRPHRAKQTVSARLPTARERGYLELGPATPVLALERTTFDADDTAFEYVRSAYRGDRYEMVLDLRAPEG